MDLVEKYRAEEASGTTDGQAGGKKSKGAASGNPWNRKPRREWLIDDGDGAYVGDEAPEGTNLPIQTKREYSIAYVLEFALKDLRLTDDEARSLLEEAIAYRADREARIAAAEIAALEAQLEELKQRASVPGRVISPTTSTKPKTDRKGRTRGNAELTAIAS
jgi:hypothetical protein